MGTNFQYGLKSRGVPLEPGVDRFYGWWGATSWFVDYDNGSDGNTGKDSTAAFKTLDKAISSCGPMDVIYIRPRGVSGTDPQGIVPDSSSVNWALTHAKEGVAIIGAGPVIGSGVHYTYLKGAASGTTGPVLDIQAPAVTIENLAFHRGGVTSNGLLRLYGDGTSANNAHNSSINNCEFRWWNQATPTCAVTIIDSWYTGIYNSIFYNCKDGINVRGSNSTIKDVTIDGCKFIGLAADISADIRLSGSNSDFLVIKDCVFAHMPPSGGTNKFISAESGHTSNGGMISNCYFDSNITAGTEISTITNMKIVNCFDSAGTINTGS
jgi:hypothetical protein